MAQPRRAARVHGRRGAILTTGALCCGLATAIALRVGIAGTAGNSSAPGGAVFGASLLLLAAAAGWRPGRLSWRTAAAGVGGGLLLIAVPLALRLATPSPFRAGSPAGDFALWAALITVVAVAEEALLRGALMGALLRITTPEIAVGMAAIAFALLHVPLYGWVVVPLDLAVGVWLGGLRLLTGGAGAPALAHTVADLATWWLR
jgi:membrane protease YdiL (CAAX protease family)